MKRLILFLFIIQETLSCVFDKVEVLSGIGTEAWSSYSETSADKCFAKCYEDKNCAGISYKEGLQLCTTYPPGNGNYTCSTGNCFILQRDEVDPVCRKYVYF
ncbi:unnamed protein product [Cylicostephanus goldi]|uniref:Apple domain-containing protein n=1 Tax=Cylicostephanus goldi TaxID=71465 RepID=A0A3P7MJT6_CYLGO|nr:unnamed protein product [Cylicostephanus goldi]